MIFGEKKSEHKNVFQFSLLICLKYFSNSKKNWYDMKYLLTAIGLTAGGRSTVHIYTQTIHRIEQDMIKMYIGLHVKYPLFLSHFNPLNPELNPICYLLALLAHRFLHVSRIMVKSLPFRLLMSCIYRAHILDVSRSHTTTHHSRYDSSGRVISSSQRPLPDNTRHSQQTNIHAPGGIRTHDLSR